MHRLALPLLLLAPLAVGCTTYRPPSTYQVQEQNTVSSAYDPAWDRILEWIAHNGLDIRSLNKESGVISAVAVPDGIFASRYLDCGEAIEQVNRTRMYGRRAECRIVARRVSDTTTSIHMTIDGSAMLSSTNGSRSIPCLSNGVAERRIAAYVENRDENAITPIVTMSAEEDAARTKSHYSWWAYAGMLPISTRDFANVHVSDWENFGLGSEEGRLALPLASASADGLYPGGGFAIGPTWDELTLFGELQGAFAPEIIFFNFIAGIMYEVVRSGSFSVSLVPKIGMGGMTADFGSVTLLPGKTPPVITSEGTFNVGDNIQTNIFGVTLQGGIALEYAFSDRVSVMLGGAWVHGLFSEMEVLAGNVRIDFDSPSIVVPEIDENGIGSSIQAGVSPEVESSGPAASLAFRFRF